MLTTDENAIAISAAKDYADNVPGSGWQDLTPLTTMLNAFIAGYRLGHTHAHCPPTNDANASYLPRLDDKPATFQLVGDRATIRVTNPQGGQQTDVHIVANPGAIAIGLSSTDHTFARTTLFAPWEE